MRCRISIFICFLFLFTVINNSYASKSTGQEDSVLISFSKFFVSKLSPKLSYEIDIKNRLLINLTSTLTVSYGIYKNDFFSAGFGVNVKWLNCLVRILIGKEYKIPIEFLNIHIITLDFYYVNVYFLRLPIYDLIRVLMYTKGKGKTENDEKEIKKRRNVFTSFSFVNPVFQLNLNRIFSDFFYSEKDII